MPDQMPNPGTWTNIAADLESPEELVKTFYRTILGRDPDPGGHTNFAEKLSNGSTLESLITIFVNGAEYRKRISKPFVAPNVSDLFPADFDPGPLQAGKSYFTRRASGFLDRFMSGKTVLDIGFRGADNPKGITAVPHAIGVDRDYPDYDGLRLPFEDRSVDTVFSSHCLEHIEQYRETLQEWYRVLKVGGFIVCIVPSQFLYEKKRHLPSKYNADHKRFYTPALLLSQVEESLEENSYRIRYLEDNDFGYDYRIGPETHAVGCFEIVLVIEKIAKPSWSLKE